MLEEETVQIKEEQEASVVILYVQPIRILNRSWITKF